MLNYTHMSRLNTLHRDTIGKIGEDLPHSDEFTEIINLNQIQKNFPVFDILAKRYDGEIYVFSAKARKRYGAGGRINPGYNILCSSYSSKYRRALELLEEQGYDTDRIHYCFMVCPLEMGNDCIYYWGELTELNPSCTRVNMLMGNIGKKTLQCRMSNKWIATYKIYGRHSWEYIEEKYMN
jgi:hypothetical protein